MSGIYFVNPSRIGAGTGTQADPFLSVASIVQTGGDVILFAAGTTCTETLTLAGHNTFVGRYGFGADPVLAGLAWNQKYNCVVSQVSVTLETGWRGNGLLGNLSNYFDDAGRLLNPYLVQNIQMPHPLATAGTWISGIRCRNGLPKPGATPIGAYMAARH